MRLRSYLSVLVLAGAIPLIVLTAVVTLILVGQQQTAVDRGLSETVTALAAVVENEIEASIKSLETLATSQRLDRNDLPAFWEQARRVRDLHHWSTVGLIDRQGNHVLNVARPLGATLPDLRDREYFRQVLTTGRPYVSDLLTGRTTATVDVAVAVPVFRQGVLKYVLFAGVEPSHFRTVFETQRLPAPAIAALVSRDGSFIARTPDHAGSVGRSLPADYLVQIRSKAHGRVRRATVAGLEVESAYKRLPVSGWTVDLAVPADTVLAPVRRITWIASLIGGGFVLGALGLALVFARRMTRDIRSLGAATATIGRGASPPAGVALGVSELEEMRGFVADADRALRERERERSELLSREQAARGEAEAASRAKDQFLAMLGHELRNPLGAIATAVGVLGQLATPDERATRARNVISRQVQHLSRLVDDLLDVTRVTTGKVRLDRHPLDLGDLVTNLVTTWRSAGRLDRHEVGVDTAPTWVEADETRMEQVVGNLLGNALKYTPSGGRVSVSVRPEDGNAVLVVADTGMGIPDRLLPAVFDLFVQGDRTLDRAQGGLGLGLTLAKALVTLHGGTIEAASDGPGCGATFTMRLALVAPPRRSEEIPVAARGAADAVRRRVLLVEDNDDAREMLRSALTLAGHEVHEAADGAAAIELATAVAPEVALIDIGLPGMDGYDVARHIRASERGKSIRLVALTGYGQAEDRLRALHAGFDSHVTKPVPPERLSELIAG